MQLSEILYYLNKKTVSKTSTAIFHSHFLIGQLIPLTWSTPPEGRGVLRLRVPIKCTKCTHPSPRHYKKWTVAERDRLSHKLPGRWAENSSKGPVRGVFKAVQLSGQSPALLRALPTNRMGSQTRAGCNHFSDVFPGPYQGWKDIFFMNTQERS